MPARARTLSARQARTIQPHATGRAASAWTTRRVAICALFVALSLLLSFVEFPIFPAAPYLKYDPSGIAALVAGLAFGPSVGLVVAVLPWVVHLFVEPFGAIMALFCAVCTVVPAAAIYQAKPTTGGLVAALIISGCTALVAAIIGNIIITPLYSGVSTADVIALIVPVLVPFNLMKIAINAVASFFAVRPVKALAQSWA